jgi:hypothetical protein
MARACIFCGSRENLNREDLWPKWLVEAVVQDRPSEIERIFGPDSTAHVYGGKWVKGRCVCEQCNGGWMSDLESKLKPILAPLIFDSSSVLDYVQQSGIAIWTLKTAMAFECIKGAASTSATANEVFYSAADRQHLMQWSTPPPDTFVWVGRYEPAFSLWIQNDHVSNARPRGLLDEGSATTFVMGRFLIQCLTVRRTPEVANELQTRRIRHEKSSWSDALMQIWLAHDNFAQWPPTQTVTGLDDLDQIARRFGRRRSAEQRQERPECTD